MIERFLDKDTLNRLVKILLDRAGLLVTPHALILLYALSVVYPKRFFDELLDYVIDGAKKKHFSIVDDTLIIEAVRKLLSVRSVRRSVSKGPQKSILDILQPKKASVSKMEHIADSVEPQSESGTIIETPKNISEPKRTTNGSPLKSTEEVSKIESNSPEPAQRDIIPKQDLASSPKISPDKPAEQTNSADSSRSIEVNPPREPTALITTPHRGLSSPIITDQVEHAEQLISELSPLRRRGTGELTRTFNVLKEVPWYIIKDSSDVFRAYFLDRFEKIKKMFGGLGRIISTADLRSGRFEDTYLVVMVMDKRYTRGERAGILIGDDPYGSVTAFIPFERNVDLKDKFHHVLKDCVVALKIDKADGRRVIASDIVFPDIPPTKTRNRSPRSLKVLVVSDIHVGSKVFMAKRFENFIRFLRGELGGHLADLADSIEYVLITGDLVDGVGVYPQQKNELNITDQVKQYEVLSKYLSLIPDDKLIIAIPGNHDVSTRLLPQPPLSEDAAKSLYELSNIKILSNPATIEIQGVKILMYHGQGFERIAGLFGYSIKDVRSIVSEILRYRHLHPEWGVIPLAPTEEDYLVIEFEPDLVLTGHLHTNSLGKYKGVGIISSGAFEGLTTWQRDIGIEPDIGHFNIVDLNTYEALTLVATEKGVYIKSSRTV